ncbi:MAG TPA: hypothetical protein VFP84_39480 [Kofleriaceae bacterium]|nr:hypothetical protein [Kofleriaceae bacterium]
MTYRNDLAALAARKTALETELRDRQRELDEANRMVEEIEARTRLPVLDNLEVAAPCTARWDKMSGDDRVRACGDCQKNVYNLSALTRDEAEALIVEKEGQLCVRYFQRADGTVLLKDCEVGVKQRRRRRWFAAGVAASLAGAGLGYGEARRHDGGCERMRDDGAHVTLGALRVSATPRTYATPPPAPPPAPSASDEAPEPPVHATMGKISLPRPGTGSFR